MSPRRKPPSLSLLKYGRDEGTRTAISVQSRTLPSSFSLMAMCIMAVDRSVLCQ
jgi:hypothetical protein